MTAVLTDAGGALTPDAASLVLPLTAAQSGMWFAQSLDPLSPAQNTAECLEVDGPLDPELFAAALRRVTAEADALRVTVEDSPDGPRQRVHPSVAVALTTHDLRDASDADREAEQWMREDLAEPFDLAAGPLFRHALLRVGEERWLWYQRIHHLVMDGFGYSSSCAGPPRCTRRSHGARTPGRASSEPSPTWWPRTRRTGPPRPSPPTARTGPRSSPTVPRCPGSRAAGHCPHGRSSAARPIWAAGHRGRPGPGGPAPRDLAGRADRGSGALHLAGDRPPGGRAGPADDGPHGLRVAAGARHGHERAPAATGRGAGHHVRRTGPTGGPRHPRGPPPPALPLRGHPPRPSAPR